MLLADSFREAPRLDLNGVKGRKSATEAEKTEGMKPSFACTLASASKGIKAGALDY